MASIEAAKGYLMKANADTGVSLYDHLSEVLSKLLAEKPENALEQLEAISAQLKATRFVPNGEAAAAAPALDGRTLARAKEIEALLKGPAPVIDKDGNLDVPPKNTLTEPSRVSVLETAELTEKAGIGLGKAEMYRIAVAIKVLGEDTSEGLASCRFWGKIYGTKSDYLVAEATTSGERASTLPQLSDEEMYDQKVVAPEVGVGANKNVYYVCARAGEPWVRLPDVTPAQITAASAIKKLFTGDLSAAVASYPPFPGKEAEYLRAQITRITVDTAIVPAGYLAEVEEEAPEEDEEEEIDPFKDEASMAAYRSKQLTTVADGHAYKDTAVQVVAPAEFEGVSDMAALTEPAAWTHTARPLLSKQGRCSWYPIPKRPKPPPAEGEEEEPEEEEPEEPEEPVAMLKSLEEDTAVAEDADGVEGSGEPAWRFRLHMSNGGGVHGKATVVSVKSVRWPGAVTLAGFGGAHSIMAAGVYIGNGAEYTATAAGVTPYSPALPPTVQTEWAPEAAGEDEEEAAPFDLVEQTDATVEEEEEELQRQAAEEEAAADNEEEGQEE
jgi:radial spoke head protein 4A